MDVNDPYVKVLDIEQTLSDLSRTVDQLRQERDDLEIALTTAVEHGDVIESQLELANRQLQSEVRERRAIEKQLRDLVSTISQKSRDLEVVLQTITEHSDEMDLDWLGRYIASENDARKDPLTGLANRRMLDETLSKEWSRARRRRQWLGMLLCDVDYFKSYNDRHGHQAGDQCLVQIAETLRQELHREGDLIARYGGEEFVLLLPDTDEKGAARVAESIQAAFQALALPHEDSPWGRITLCIGTAAVMPGGEDSSLLFAEVDRRLYRAKQQGRNQVVSCD